METPSPQPSPASGRGGSFLAMGVLMLIVILYVVANIIGLF